MNRENTGAKPTAPPRLPPEAEQEILEALFEGMEIHSSEIAAILKKHGVCGDVEALQDSYRKRLGQRLMASLRDEGGKREVLANGKGSYVVPVSYTHLDVYKRQDYSLSTRRAVILPLPARRSGCRCRFSHSGPGTPASRCPAYC